MSCGKRTRALQQDSGLGDGHDACMPAAPKLTAVTSPPLAARQPSVGTHPAVHGCDWVPHGRWVAPRPAPAMLYAGSEAIVCLAREPLSHIPLLRVRQIMQASSHVSFLLVPLPCHNMQASCSSMASMGSTRMQRGRTGWMATSSKQAFHKFVRVLSQLFGDRRPGSKAGRSLEAMHKRSWGERAVLEETCAGGMQPQQAGASYCGVMRVMDYAACR